MAMALRKKTLMKGLLALLFFIVIVYGLLQLMLFRGPSPSEFYSISEITSLAPQQDKASAKDWYDLTVLLGALEYFDDKNKDKFLSLKSKLEEAFTEKCSKPSECDPYKYLLPYCLIQESALRVGVLNDEEYEEALKNPLFLDSLEYWHNYFTNKASLSSTDLEKFRGYIFAAHACGNKLYMPPKEELKEKILNIQINTPDVKELLRLYTFKISLYRLTLEKNQISAEEEPEIFADVCEKLKHISAEDLNDVCSFNYFIGIKLFCKDASLSSEEKEKYEFFMNKKYNTREEVLCHMGLLARRKRFP